jgi:multidrug efflux pump subunit AcrB
VQAFTNLHPNVPQVYANVDRTKAQMLDIPVNNVFEAMQIYLGSMYVNDFNFLGRTYRVTAQAEPEFRDEPSDILKIRTRSARGATVSLGSVVEVEGNGRTRSLGSLQPLPRSRRKWDLDSRLQYRPVANDHGKPGGTDPTGRFWL